MPRFERLITTMWVVGGLALALSTTTAHAQEITHGPYLQDLRTDGATVVWEGPGWAGATPSVGYGVAATDENNLACSCQATHCWCDITGAQPDVVYLYDIKNAGVEVNEGGTFRTAPDYAKPFKFAVFGDNRSDASSHQLVIDAMIDDYAFIFNTGDMVADGEVEAQWQQFFEIETPLLRNVPLYPSVGNHEVDGDDLDIFLRLFHTPAQASGSGEKSYYSYNYGNSHFVVIDGFYRVEPWYLCLLQLKFYDNCITAEQQQWLQSDLQWASNNADIDHVFVFMHEGPYSSKEGRTGSQQIRELLPLFADHKVKIVFSGHDHYYEHGKTGNGLHYVITGGGGAPLYKTGDNIWNVLFPHDILMSESVHNYQVVEVDGDYIKVTTHNVDAGNVLEEFEIGSKAPCNTVADCAGEEPGTCLGGWECKTYGCSWTCDPEPEPDACLTANDCGSDPGGGCNGDWECPIGTFKCVWVCDGSGQCSNDGDCAGAEPLNACQGGTWKCEASANVCEWHCEGPVPVPDEAPDAAAEPVPDAAPDASMPEPMPDAAGPEPAPEPAPDTAADADAVAPSDAVANSDEGTTAPQDATVSAPDSSGGGSGTPDPSTGAGSPQTGDTSDGCVGAPPTRLPWWWTLFFLSAAVAVRGRRRSVAA